MPEKKKKAQDDEKLLGTAAAGDPFQPELRAPSDANFGVVVEPQDQDKTGSRAGEEK